MSKKTDAWMPLWIGSYLADTQHLTREEHGAYLLLLMAYWRNQGPLLDDDKRLASIVRATPAEWRRLRPVVTEFFDIQDGRWSQKRADQELAGAGLRKENATSKAKKAAQARWGSGNKDAPSNAPSMPQALLEDMHDDCPTPSPIPLKDKDKKISSDKPDLPPGFVTFWSIWPNTNRRVAKAKCAEKWRKTGLEELADIILPHVQREKAHNRQWRDGYEPAPLTYLNERRWEDDSGLEGGPPDGGEVWSTDL